MKIETRYGPDKSAEQKGEDIMESSWGKHYRKRYCNWSCTFKNDCLYAESQTHLRGGRGAFGRKVLCKETVLWRERRESDVHCFSLQRRSVTLTGWWGSSVSTLRLLGLTPSSLWRR